MGTDIFRYNWKEDEDILVIPQLEAKKLKENGHTYKEGNNVYTNEGEEFHIPEPDFSAVSVLPSVAYISYKPHTFNRFTNLKDLWMQDIQYHSNPDLIINNKHYQAIIKMQFSVVPYLLEDLRNGQGDWFYALREIIGVDPIKKEHYGDFDAMANDWLLWSALNLGM